MSVHKGVKSVAFPVKYQDKISTLISIKYIKTIEIKIFQTTTAFLMSKIPQSSLFLCLSLPPHSLFCRGDAVLRVVDVDVPMGGTDCGELS